MARGKSPRWRVVPRADGGPWRTCRRFLTCTCRNRNPSEVGWSAYDFIALIQLTVDTVVALSGLDGNLGAPRPAVLTEMTRAAAAMAPARPAEEHAHVAAHVLDHLLRHDEPTPYFPVGYADPDDGWRPDASRSGSCTRRSLRTGPPCTSTWTTPRSRCCSSRPTGRWKTSTKRSSRSCRPRPTAAGWTPRSTPLMTRSPSHVPTPRTSAG